MYVTDGIRPRRRITGMSAVLMPHTPDGVVDWPGFEAHLVRTVESGLTPAVNMDTGYVQTLSEPAKERVLAIAAEITGGDFVAGAFVRDRPGDSVDLDAYQRAACAVADHGGTPVLFRRMGSARSTRLRGSMLTRRSAPRWIASSVSSRAGCSCPTG